MSEQPTPQELDSLKQQTADGADVIAGIDPNVSQEADPQ